MVLLRMTILQVNRVTHPALSLLGWVWEYPIWAYNGFGEYIKTRIAFGARMGFAVNAPAQYINYQFTLIALKKCPKSPSYI